MWFTPNVVFLYICHAYTVHLQSHMFGQLDKHWSIHLHDFIYILFINSIPCCVDLNAFTSSKWVFHQKDSKEKKIKVS